MIDISHHNEAWIHYLRFTMSGQARQIIRQEGIWMSDKFFLANKRAAEGSKAFRG